VITTKRGQIKPRGVNQKQYVENILSSDVTLGIGPAGTGKTYLAVAAAVDALERQEVRRILLTRPAVEALIYDLCMTHCMKCSVLKESQS